MSERHQCQRFRSGCQPLLWVVFIALLPVPALAECDESAGLRLTPELSWSDGDHRVDLQFSSRFRWERWESLTSKSDNFYAFRTRLGGEYTWKDRLRLFAEGQLTNVFDLDSSASGAAALYRSNAHKAGSNSVDGLRVRQRFAEARLDSES